MPCSKPNCDCLAQYEKENFGIPAKDGYPCLYPGDWPPDRLKTKTEMYNSEKIDMSLAGVGKKALVIPETFLCAVQEMRDVQRAFFNGNRSVVARAKKLEALVDAQLNKILSDAGWTPTEWDRRPPPTQQGGLF